MHKPEDTPDRLQNEGKPFLGRACANELSCGAMNQRTNLHRANALKRQLLYADSRLQAYGADIKDLLGDSILGKCWTGVKGYHTAQARWLVEFVYDYASI